ncbi:MAG: DUF1570 domain-containing protein, partial [Thermoguttaceae bacterium]
MASFSAAGAEPPLARAGAANETIDLLDGRHYEGFIESEDPAWIDLIEIHRPPGQPMHLVIRPLDRRSVAAVVRLDEAGRGRLKAQIEQFRNRAVIEAGRIEAVRLEPAEAEGNHYRRYHGQWFTLDSTTDEASTRRVIVRVEQIFTAYRQMLAPRSAAPPRPLRVIVFGSMDAYQGFLARRGLNFQNRACFLEGENLVAAGTDLTRLASQIAWISSQHNRIRRDLEQLEKRFRARQAELAQQFKKDGLDPREIPKLLVKEKAEFDKQVKEKREELNKFDRKNAALFNAATQQMFARLYHESFHAYLENYVYPHQRHDVPHWLNEGLAMMFEAGILDGDTLRVDAPHGVALKKLREDLLVQPLSLTKLLEADQSAFLTAEHASPTSSNRHYVYAWGLVYYLAFQRHLLDSAALDAYVQPGAKTAPPVARFEKLVAMP